MGEQESTPAPACPKPSTSACPQRHVPGCSKSSAFSLAFSVSVGFLAGLSSCRALSVRKESRKSTGLPLHDKCKIIYPVFLCSAINKKA